MKYGSFLSTPVIYWRLGLFIVITQFTVAQSPPTAQRITTELPRCSVLNAELQEHSPSHTVDQPYMALMRRHGVQRALLLIHADLHKGTANNIRVHGRLYFRSLDGPNTQIEDQVTLQDIESSGLGAELDRIACNRASTAPFLRAADMRLRAAHTVFSAVDLFADLSLPEQKLMLLPMGHPTLLTEAVIHGDALRTQELLGSQKFSKKQLDRALFDAALSRYDNTTVIQLLLRAGADVNARTSDGTTPLVNAVGHPCNLLPLLAGGADLNARDKWGRDALRVAREVKESTAVRLLEEARSKKEPKS
jgi:hypothetical protein